jgi:competence protein ComFB
MDIRNLMEDAVLSVVGELFELEEKGHPLGFCTCSQCRLDVACYVLNRIKPEYIVSSRGLAYSERNTLDRVQKRVDIISLAKEGWSLVDHRPRITTDHAFRPEREIPQGPAFNLPTVMGRAFNGLNFEPLSAGALTLLINGAQAEMVDRNWQNPFVFAAATAGTFIFWPLPEHAQVAGEEKRFSCELRLEAEGFDPLSHFFEFELAADKVAKEDFSLLHVHKTPDIYIFPSGTVEGEDE